MHNDQKINVNQYVKVRLTAHGRRTHIQRWAEVLPELPYKPFTEKDGWSRWQLWDFMNWFGSAMDAGTPVVIENCEMFLEADEAESSPMSSKLMVDYIEELGKNLGKEGFSPEDQKKIISTMLSTKVAR